MSDQSMNEDTHALIILGLGMMIFASAVLGGWYLIQGHETTATIVFSTLATLSASMAAISTMDRRQTDQETETT